MKQLRDTVWQRRGISWIWDAEALGLISAAREAWSLRRFIEATGKWPEELPSNRGNAIVVAGMDGCLDLLSPGDAEHWLGAEAKDAILSFQDFRQGDGALIFWLPGGNGRIKTALSTDAVSWCCAAPHADVRIEFGRVLWGEAREYPQLIVLRDGGKPVGLYHLRIT